MPTKAKRAKRAQPLQINRSEAVTEAPRVLVAPAKRLKIAGGRQIRDPQSNTGIHTVPPWVGVWVALEGNGINDAIYAGIEIPEVGDERVTNQARFRPIERGGQTFLGRTDTIVGLVTQEQYDQYMIDLAAEGERKLDADGGTLTRKKLTREQLIDDARAAEATAKVTLVPPPPVQ